METTDLKKIAEVFRAIQKPVSVNYSADQNANDDQEYPNSTIIISNKFTPSNSITYCFGIRMKELLEIITKKSKTPAYVNHVLKGIAINPAATIEKYSDNPNIDEFADFIIQEHMNYTAKKFNM